MSEAPPAPLAPRDPTPQLTSLRLPDLYQLGKVLVGTGFLPAAIKTPEQAVAVMLKGQELRVPPMYALSNIAVISGKPACTAELMLALLYRDHGDAALRVTETTATRCAAAYKRRGWREAQTFAFTLEDAKTAGLSGGNWAKYPAAMLRARCISAIARMAFPDSIGGMYTAEGPEPVSPMAIATQREPEAEAEAGAPREGEFEAPTPQQLETLAKLGRLTGEEVDPTGYSKAEVGAQVVRLSLKAHSAKRRAEAGR